MPVSINGSGAITFNDGSIQNTAATGFGFKNRIINGDMRIDQRNAGASVTITNTAAVTYTLDRWFAYGSQASRFSVQQNAGSVTPPAGFRSYFGITSLSSYSVASGEVFTFGQYIEGFNAADFSWGTANASSVTLSFWVRSSLTGTFGGALQNQGASRSYPFSYTISAANTWEQKSITIPGETSGTWLTTNGMGIALILGLGVGSAFSGTAGSWATSNIQSVTGATSVVGTNGATFYITGVQLEKGSTATSFDYRPYGTELALCQRYYWRLSATSGGPLLGFGAAATSSEFHAIGNYVVQMRSAPTFDFNSLNVSSASGGTFAVTANNGITATETTYRAVFGTGGGLTTNTHPYFLRANGTGWIAFSAEL